MPTFWERISQKSKGLAYWEKRLLANTQATAKRILAKAVVLGLIVGGIAGLYFLSRAKRDFERGSFQFTEEARSKLLAERIGLPQPVIDQLNKQAGEQGTTVGALKRAIDAGCQNRCTDQQTVAFESAVVRELETRRRYRVTERALTALRSATVDFPEEIRQKILTRRDQKADAPARPLTGQQLFRQLDLAGIGSNIVTAPESTKDCFNPANRISIKCTIVRLSQVSRSAREFRLPAGIDPKGSRVRFPDAAIQHLCGLLKCQPTKKQKAVAPIEGSNRQELAAKLNRDELQNKIGAGLTDEFLRKVEEASEITTTVLLERVPVDLETNFPVEIIPAPLPYPAEPVVGEGEFISKLKKAIHRKQQELYADRFDGMLKKVATHAARTKIPEAKRTGLPRTLWYAALDKESGHFHAIYSVLAIFCAIAASMGLLLALLSLLRAVRLLPATDGEKTVIDLYKDTVKTVAETKAATTAGLLAATAAAGIGAAGLIATPYLSQQPHTTNNSNAGDTINRPLTNNNLPGTNDELDQALKALQESNANLKALLDKKDSLDANLIQELVTQREKIVADVTSQLATAINEQRKEVAAQMKYERAATYAAIAQGVEQSRRGLQTALEQERATLQEELARERDRSRDGQWIERERTNGALLQLKYQTSLRDQAISKQTEAVAAQISNSEQFHADLRRLQANRWLWPKIKQFFGGATIYMLTDDQLAAQPFPLKDEACKKQIAWHPYTDVKKLVADLNDKCKAGLTRPSRKDGGWQGLAVVRAATVHQVQRVPGVTPSALPSTLIP